MSAAVVAPSERFLSRDHRDDLVDLEARTVGVRAVPWVTACVVRSHSAASPNRRRRLASAPVPTLLHAFVLARVSLDEPL